MTALGEFSARLEGFQAREAMIWRDAAFRFADLLALRFRQGQQYIASAVGPGAVVAIEGGFSPAAVSALLAVLEAGGVAVPVAASVASKKAECYETAEVEWVLAVAADDSWTLQPTGRRAGHELIRRLRLDRHPGLILFSSGSTGRSKAVVHDMEMLLRKYLKPRHCYRTLAFLLFDHIGGLDTLLYGLANGSCLVTVRDSSPDSICAAIAAHRVEVLPVSPTFINLLLLSGACERHDLSGLLIITYGAEVMPKNTLLRLRQALPKVKLVQKFGTTEVGTLRSQSRSSDSVWVRIGGEGFQTRVVEGLLEIKAESAMLGYLNAPSPFTADGWFKTGDAVETDGEWMRILGRKSEMINVGGEKLYPSEVEGVLEEMEGVLEATVTGEPNPITGQMVLAKVSLATGEGSAAFRKRLWEYCRNRLPPYKTPQKVLLIKGPVSGERFKKMRLKSVVPARASG